MVRQEDRKKPKPYLDTALKLFKERNGKVIVEIGSMRQPLNHDINNYSFPCCNDGHSSIILALACEDFYSVDIDINNCYITRDCLLKHNVKKALIIHGDGIRLLEQFDKPIDLLYLDAWDVGTPNYAEMHLLAYNLAKKNLHEKSLILIDDTDVFLKDGEYFISEQGLKGKGILVIPEALKDGWKILFTERVTCLIQS